MSDTYEVVDQGDVLDISEPGNPRPMWQVDFTTKPHNVRTFIRVPKVPGFADAAIAAVAAEAADIERVHTS
jgi:hypothetical protein